MSWRGGEVSTIINKNSPQKDSPHDYDFQRKQKKIFSYIGSKDLNAESL